MDRRAFIGTLAGGAVAAPLAARAQKVIAPPEYRVEVVVSGVPHVIDAIEPFPGVLLASVGAAVPGSRLLRFPLSNDPPGPVVGLSGDALLSSRWRLGPIETYRFTGRIYVGVPEQGQIIELPPLTRDLPALAHWEPRPFIVGLTALHDFAFGSDSRLRIADGARVLEAPIYFTPPMEAARLRTIHRCPGACQGVAVVGKDLLVLEADGQAGRVVRRDSRGIVQVVVAAPPRPGEGLGVGSRGDLFFPSEAGILRATTRGDVVRVLSGVSARARVNLDPKGHPLVADPDRGAILRLYVPVE